VYTVKHNKKRKQLTPEEALLIKKKNKYVINKIKQWQAFPYVKPLVCRKCNQAKLEPKPTKFKVILKCPECSNIQYYIPKPILQTRLNKPDVLIRNQEKYGQRILAELNSDDED
jgi:hypothetical protein